MELKDKIRNVLREVYGGFDSYLENEYEKYVTESLYSGDIKSKQEWITYNQVILELKHNLKDMLRVKELQYKLTEDKNPRKVCIEVIQNLDQKTPELERLYDKINNF